jgi:3-phenylpropionate/trans-cinnamate dioxygenase ferredoxin subunit
MFNYSQFDESKLEYIEIAPSADLPPGERLFVELDGKPIMVFNLVGSLFAIGDVCTHDNGPLGDGEVDGCEVVCPRHGARFDVRTGQTLGLPAVVDIPAYPVRVVEGMIRIGIPR